MYIRRSLSSALHEALSYFPAILITGPRQSGKTTLLKEEIKKAQYVTFDDPLMQEFAVSDPKGFLLQYGRTETILDEIQYVPSLFSYLKMDIDNKRDKAGRWILTGSQQFNVMKEVSDSLAGRIAVLNLLPFSYEEYYIRKRFPVQNIIYNGSYPEAAINPAIRNMWLSSYIHTYIERDVRQLVNIKDLRFFQTFIGLCAACHGQELNAASISRECGVAQPTILRWISILENSFIIYLLKPYYKNLGKRLIKSPKLYFIESAIAAFLTRQGSPDALFNGASGGAFFEGYIISETYKMITGLNKNAELFFWRSHDGMEIDLIIEFNGRLYPVEIKKTSTPSLKHAESLKKFINLAGAESIGKAMIVCTVNNDAEISDGISFMNWKSYFNFIIGLLNEG